MEVRKEAGITGAGAPTPEQLAKINLQARAKLAEKDVYVFAVRLCDNLPDRDFERFDEKALRALAPMFVGKTGIMDHAWSSDKQVARIFETAVIEEGKTVWIKAWAYMLRGDKTDAVIREIDGGIKKEVSVGCAMTGSVCSICGAEFGSCEHEKGQVYGGATCYAILRDPVDAYEFSFVAVPAQKAAGVVKGKSAAVDPELNKLAAYGREYRKMLIADVVKGGLVLDIGLAEKTLRQVAEHLDMESLTAVRDAFSAKTAELFPPATQLSADPDAGDRTDSAFLI